MLVSQGITVKESIPELLQYLAEHPDQSAKQALGKLGLEMLEEEQLRAIIDEVVKGGSELITERGMGAMGQLMGAVMAKVRGKAQPKLVQRLLQKAIKSKLA